MPLSIFIIIPFLGCNVVGFLMSIQGSGLDRKILEDINIEMPQASDRLSFKKLYKNQIKFKKHIGKA